MYSFFRRVYWDRHGFGSGLRMNSRTLTLSRVWIGGAMFKTSHRPMRVDFSASLSKASSGCFLLDFLMFFLLCEKKVVLLYRNLTAVKFTAIKSWPKLSTLDISKKLKIFARQGFVDVDKHRLFDSCYEQAGMFVNGLANIKDDRNGKWGDINTKGKYMFQPRYDNTYCFTNGHHIPPVKAAGKRGLILLGREVFRR